MTYYCEEWAPADLTRHYFTDHPNREGHTVEEIYDWYHNDCSFTANATVTLDGRGNWDSEQVDVDYDHANCDTHDRPLIDLPDFDLWERVRDTISAAEGWVCGHDDHDTSEAPVFSTLAGLEDHHTTEHEAADENENDLDDLGTNLDDLATHPEHVPALPHFHRLATIEHLGHPEWPMHPPITPSMRLLARNLSARQVENGREAPRGFLIPTHSSDIMHCGYDPITADTLARWARSWPDHFYIAADDPHLISISARSTHATWGDT